MEAHRGGKGGWRQKGASRRRAESLIWMDLEMTGLDPESDSILEIACVVTDAHLETTLLGPNLAIYQPEEVLAGMNAWCVEHHGRSGLTERCRTSVVSLEEAEAQVLEFVEAHTPAGKIPLCGNTIHCDLAFLKRHMPRCEPPLPLCPPSPSPKLFAVPKGQAPTSFAFWVAWAGAEALRSRPGWSSISTIRLSTLVLSRSSAGAGSPIAHAKRLKRNSPTLR